MADEDEDEKLEGEGAAGEGGVEEQPKKKFGLKKIILFIVLPLLLIGGGAGGAYMAGLFGGEMTEEEAAAAAESARKDGVPIFYALPEMIVNLQSERGRQVFLELDVKLELENEQDIPILEKILPRIIDDFQLYLRELRVEEIRGSGGLYRLREELLTRVNLAAHPVRIRGVLFGNFLVQQ